MEIIANAVQTVQANQNVLLPMRQWAAPTAYYTALGVDQ